MEAEATMICVDNGGHMLDTRLFCEQYDAIEYYCTKKLNANSKNVVGVASMADHYHSIATYPTRDLEEILLGVRSLPRGGDLLLAGGVINAYRVWCTNLNKDLPKRIVVFAGGVINEDTDIATRLGLWLKKWDIAFDAVYFAHHISHKKKLFETMVATGENKRHSCTLDVPPNLSVSEALARSQIIPTRIGESSSPPPGIKDKEYYSRIPYVSLSDMIDTSIEYAFEYARQVAALEENLTSSEEYIKLNESTTMEAEATMICVDNSSHLLDKRLFWEQYDAIKYYCTQKLNANSKNVVGIASMTDRYHSIATYPTRDLEKIMLGVRSLPIGGDLLLAGGGVIDAYRVWCTNFDKDLPKRIVVFAGGVINEDTETAKRLGQWLKQWDIAVDAVYFAHHISHKKKLFETLVANGENKRHSRTLDVPPNLSVSEALARSQIIPIRIGESSSPPLDIKDKDYYLRIPYVSQRDIIARSIGNVFECARKAAALEKANS